MILFLDTRGPENRIALWHKGKWVAEETLQRLELSEKLSLTVRDLLSGQEKQMSDLIGIVVHRGPGSFTGLRIGLSYANGLAYGLGVSLVGIEESESLSEVLHKPLQSDALPVLPIYSSEPKTSTPKDA